MTKKGPVKGTWIKNGRYYRVVADGKKRIWVPLTRVDEGEAAFFMALAAELQRPVLRPDSMAVLIADWQRDVMPRHAAKTQKDEVARCKVIAESFSEFTAADVRPPDVADFLQPLKVKPRTHNLYRALLRELMRFAEERGMREPGTNPVTALRTMSTPPRKRYITDSEMRRIKVAAMRGDDDKATRSGPTLCALIDVAMMTAQRIGDLLKLEWDQVTDAGIVFVQAKTGAKVTVEWSPKLAAAVDRLRQMRKERRGFTPKVFTTQDGKPYTYWGASAAWKRAVKRAGIAEVTFHDLRRKAATEVTRKHGIAKARALLGHTTEQQTADYVSAVVGQIAQAAR